MNFAIKISSVCCCEQNSSLLFHSIFQENMNLYQKSFLKYNMSYFIETSFLSLLNMRSHSACHAVKQDHFSSEFHWWYFSFDHSTFFLAISSVTNEHMFLQYSHCVFWFVKLAWQSDLNVFLQYFTKKSVTSAYQIWLIISLHIHTSYEMMSFLYLFWW